MAPELDGALGFYSPGVTVLSLLLLSSDVVGELSILVGRVFKMCLEKLIIELLFKYLWEL